MNFIILESVEMQNWISFDILNLIDNEMLKCYSKLLFKFLFPHLIVEFSFQATIWHIILSTSSYLKHIYFQRFCVKMGCGNNAPCFGCVYGKF